MVINKIVEKLEREGHKIEQFFSSLSAIQLEAKVYLDAQEWQIRDILAHFISAEIAFLELFKNIRNGGAGAPDNFSINEYNDSQVLKMKDLETKKLLVLFGETRSITLNWIKDLSEEELTCQGRHPAMGDSTLGEMIKMIYLHNQMHMRDIKNALESFKTE